MELKEKLALALEPAVADAPPLVPDEANNPTATTKLTKHEQALAVVRAHPDLSAKALMGMNLRELEGISLPTLAKARVQVSKEGGAVKAKRSAAPAAAPQTEVRSRSRSRSRSKRPQHPTRSPRPRPPPWSYRSSR